MNNILKQIPASLKGDTIVRKESCRICKEKNGIQIGNIDYWDIAGSKIVKCEKCGLAQLDPMISHEGTSRGCLAYYIEESLRVSEKEQGRNMLRNFRRGFLFGTSLKKRGLHPKNVLELGPGSGYFSEGLKFAFPDTKITVMDVNPEVLNFNKQQHGHNTIETSIEEHISELDSQFDLIIACDILEHVVDISKVIENIYNYSSENGLFHFTTPNGHEDVWKHYLTFKHWNSTSELLINHVNYFDGKGLLDFLVKKNFSAIEYFTFKMKTTRRGRGWKVSEKLMAPVSRKKDSSIYIDEKINELKTITVDKKTVLNKWYINKNWKFLTYIVSFSHHANLIKLSPELNVGHEIYGLFKITKN